MTRLLCICIFCMSMSVFSQENDVVIDVKNEPLSTVLPSLESQFNIRFSYVNNTIGNKMVTLKIASSAIIKDVISTLEKQTQLKFEIIGDQFITIRKYKNDDIVTICGYLYDENSKPIDDVEIFIKDTQSFLNSNDEGFFKINKISYGTSLVFSKPGFKQIQMKVSTIFKTECIDLLLTTNVEILDEVLIQEYLTKGITLDKKEVQIDIEDVAILPGLIEPDILQSIQLTPGVNSPFETASGLFVRGGVPSQNLVLWNGIKTYNQGHFFGLISAFNPYVVKEVHFAKSGVSAYYGDRISGVVDIKSDTEVIDGFSGNAGFNMINADAVIKTPIIKDKVSLQISGRRSFTDLFETFTYNQYADRVFQNTSIAEDSKLDNAQNDFFYTDYSANLVAQISDVDKLTINALYSKNNLDFRRGNEELSFNDDLSIENEGYNVNWKHLWNKKLTFQAGGYYTKYLLNYDFITRVSNTIEETESKKNIVEDIGASLDLSYTISENQNFIGGYQFSNNNIKYAFLTTTPSYELTLDQDDRFINTHSLYGEYKYEIPKDWYISGGLRFNNYAELEQSFLEPRIFVEKHITNYWKLNVTGEYRSQSVSQIRESVVSDLSLENQVWTLANREQFPVITSYQFTVGSNYKRKNWSFDIDAYYKQIDDITSLTSGFINPVNNTHNNGESRIYGVDFFLKKEFNDYKSWVSYSYINTRNIFEDINNNESFPGNSNIEHTVKWSHFYKINNFQFSLGWLWHTGKAFTNISRVGEDGGFVLLDFERINENNLPVYHRLDFSAIYDFKIKESFFTKYRLGISVLNIYDRNNILNREFRTTNSLDNELINSDISGLGITPNLSFRVFW